MPQLDSWTYLGQILFISSLFFVLYYVSKSLLLPLIATSLKTPVKLTQSLNSSSLQSEVDYTRSI